MMVSVVTGAPDHELLGTDLGGDPDQCLRARRHDEAANPTSG